MKRTFIGIMLVFLLCMSVVAGAQSAEEWLDKAGDAIAAGDFEEAKEYCTKAIEAEPDSAWAYYHRGRVNDSLGMLNEAVLDYTKAIELDPGFALHSFRGWDLYLLGEYERALEDLNVSIEMDPYELSFLDTRANIYREMGRYDEALADIERAIEIYPDRAVVYFTRGLIYRDIGDGERALADFTKACDMGDEEACAALEESGE